MPFAIGDLVTLAAARGGHNVYVTEFAGFTNGQLYRTKSPNGEDPAEGTVVVSESDIAAGPLTLPTYTVGQSVSLYNEGGTVVADNGDDTYDIDVDWFPNRDMTLTRHHLAVPTWRLALENT